MDGGNILTLRTQERRRVTRHLAGAEQLARGRRAMLDPLQALNRSLLLDELGRYRRRGRFPLNQAFRTRAVPEFVDSHGSRCAVAHLLEISGQAELVRHIASTDNNARVRKLARLPELRAWLVAAGLSLDEAARIQPEYCFVSQAQSCFCGEGAGSGLSTVAVATIIEAEARSIRVVVDRVEGRRPDAGAFPISVGDQQQLDSPGMVGGQVLLSRDPVEGYVDRIGWNLVIDGETVRCQLNPDTAGRPVSIDTVIEALLAEGPSCVEVLATDDSAWNRSQCDAQPAESQASNPLAGGCGFTQTDAASLGGAGLTSAALLAALVTYRRKRRSSR